MNADEFVQLLQIASEVGFRCAKFTGGEPLLRQKNLGDLTIIIQRVRPYFDELDLVTNGYLLAQYAQELKDAGLDRLTVSLNSSSAANLNRYAGVSAFASIMRGLEKCKEIGLPITLNCILSKVNCNELHALIDLAGKFSAKLKLLDLMNLSDAQYWKTNYLNFKQIEDQLGKVAVSVSWVFPPGGLGSPMPKYLLKNGVEVFLRDATIGTNYHETCKDCVNFPCQDALISLRLTSDGKLKRCLIRDDNLVEILTDLRKGDLQMVKNKIESCYRILIESKFFPFKWHPGGLDENERTVQDVDTLCKAYLRKLEFENPELETKLLIEEVFGSEVNPNHVLTKEEKARLEEYFNGFSVGMPIQYQIGYTRIRSLKIFITEDVLLPGLEIGYLIGACIECLKSIESKPPIIVDMCTGPGALAIALAREWPNSRIYATDLSEKALAVARKSIIENNVNNVALIKGDMFTALEDSNIKGKVDLVVSNPPYVPTEDIKKLPIQIRAYAPQQAIDGGVDGFKFHRIIAQDSAKYLKLGGFLVLENNVGQSETLLSILRSTGAYECIRIGLNQKGEKRIIVARRLK
jgi:release factor glutamine methyltransferase